MATIKLCDLALLVRITSVVCSLGVLAHSPPPPGYFLDWGHWHIFAQKSDKKNVEIHKEFEL